MLRQEVCLVYYNVKASKGVVMLRIRYVVVRALAGLIDLIIVYVPAVILFSLWFHVATRWAELLAQLLFLAYNVAAVSTFHGQTIGKYFARLRVDTRRLVSDNVLFVGMREMTKLLFLTPVIGVPLGLLNLLLALATGRMLEDFVGQSDVVVVERTVKPIDG